MSEKKLTRRDGDVTHCLVCGNAWAPEDQAHGRCVRCEELNGLLEEGPTCEKCGSWALGECRVCEARLWADTEYYRNL